MKWLRKYISSLSGRLESDASEWPPRGRYKLVARVQLLESRVLQSGLHPAGLVAGPAPEVRRPPAVVSLEAPSLKVSYQAELSAPNAASETAQLAPAAPSPQANHSAVVIDQVAAPADKIEIKGQVEVQLDQAVQTRLSP